MNIQIRPIQQGSTQDRENYFALQKSVALFPDKGLSDKKEYEDKSWWDQFENKNRICYVIETVPELFYCGECAVKDISDDIPEIEIELMQEYQYQGIGYKAIIMMLNKLAKQYGKQEFYAKIEPDNYASQFLFEKLGGIPAGVVKDYEISDERIEQFILAHRYLLDEQMQAIAKKFEIEPDMLLTHLLIYKIHCKDLETDDLNVFERTNKRERIECLRNLSKEKYKDALMEWLDDLEEIKNFGEAKDKIIVKIADMESKLLNKIELMKTIDLN